MTNPIWRAPIATNTYQAGDITQFEFSHPSAFLYQGTAQETGATRTGTLNTNTGSAAQWIAQPFTTTGSQTTVTRVEIDFLIGGTGADLTIDLQTDSGGNPSGTALYSITFPLDFLPGSHALVSFPFNATGLSTSTMYHVVVHGTASTSNFAELGDGTTVTQQALISANGSSWSGAGKTLVFNVFSGINGVLRNTIEDVTPPAAPAKWTGLDYANGSAGTAGPPTTLREYVGALRSIKTISYTSGLPTGAS